MVDWLAIKTEYVTGTISQRKLAEKHGVSYASLRTHSEKERWVDLRKEQQRKIDAETAQKSVEKISDAASDTAAIKARLDQKLWSLIDQAAGELSTDGAIDPADLRRVVQCYVDMRGLPEDMQSNMDQHNALMDALKEAAEHDD